jgi:site-specific recombinase XerD
MTPLRLALAAAVAKGLLEANPADQVVLPRRRAGRAWSMRERRFLTRAELGQLLDEVPRKWRPLLELLAATGLRISEAIGLRWSDLALDGSSSHLQVRRAVVGRVVVAPKSRHGARLISLSGQVAATLRDHRPSGAARDAYVFPGRGGAPSDPGSLRRRVLAPAAKRAGLTGVGFHTLRHTCASMLIEGGLSPRRLQRWLGHHSAAFTLEVYGHLLDGDLGPPLDIRRPDRADYLALKARGLSHTRASLTIARKLARRCFHTLRELGPDALEPSSDPPRSVPPSPPIPDGTQSSGPLPQLSRLPSPGGGPPKTERPESFPADRPIDHHVAGPNAEHPDKPGRPRDDRTKTTTPQPLTTTA